VDNVTGYGSNPPNNNVLQDSDSELVPKLVAQSEIQATDTGNSSSGAGDTVTKPTEPTDETRLAVLAELLAGLPEVDRRELIADLSPADRVAIAGG
jgi:hypothetical protein